MSDLVSDICDEAGESGSLLAELERRQDDVLNLLDDLDRRLTDVLKGLGVTLVDENEPAGLPRLLNPEECAAGEIGTGGYREQHGGYGAIGNGETPGGFIRLPRADAGTPAPAERPADADAPECDADAPERSLPMNRRRAA